MSIEFAISKDDFTYLKEASHKSLILCEHINQGIRKNIDPERIKKYCIWFFEHYLKKHFELEEKYVFPILGNDHPTIKRALKEHRKIKRLTFNQTEVVKSINLLEELLESHIRFEERILFVEIQKKAKQEIKNITLKHLLTDVMTNTWSDIFWESAS